ncbi:MAG: aminoacyl-tRNA hydrolase [Acidimicrobiia bacterium]|nr:aminoacyl-tRNA hydrolase [Acidimicrobiia bacterium]
MNDDLRIDSQHVISEGELSWTFSTSGGPGGQHANRSNTRAILSFDVLGSPAFSDTEKDRLDLELPHHGGVITITVDESRSQWRNRQMARKRLADLIAEALRPRPTRRATRIPRRAHEKRLSDKRARSERKRDRQPPAPD